MTPQDVLALCRERDVKAVDLRFMDLPGLWQHFTIPVKRVMAQLPTLMSGRELAAYETRRDALVAGRVPDELATKVAVLHPSYMLLSIVETAAREELEPADVARLHFALGERLNLPSLVARILELPRADRWQTMARAALRDDLYAVHAQLTAQALGATTGDDAAEKRIEAWERDHGILVQRTADTLDEICSDDTADLARMSVGLRVVRGLLAGG